MSNNKDDINNSENQEELINNESHSDYTPASRFDASAVHHLSGMYQGWFLAYASYVILERAVPHIEDGLKPVQRRILHSMKRMDDGRYNKVANIVGHTMQFHPHGDASIGDALVQMGQKNLLIDMQGNWGNILTGDRAAAPRYIEARLSQFALDVVFNPKTTNWQLSYDGRNQEPITLPAKFPLLLAQGADVIREIPFSKTTTSLIDSILKAIDKGKIKAKKVDDNTAAEVEIQIHLASGVSSDKTIDALYAFSDCEVNISPNCCVIEDQKPRFMTVSEVLRHSVDSTMGLLRKELQIRKDELLSQLFFASLESIFIEERIYKDKKFEQAANVDAAIKHIDERLEPFKKDFIREITRDDILRLLEIKMQRILKFNKEKAEELIAKMKQEIKDIDYKLAHMVAVTIEWFTFLKEKYGKEHQRLTEIRNFDTIEATKVVEANEKLYINRQEGFIGTSLKKDEFVCNCSDIDDIIIFYKDGLYKIIKVAEKIFVGKNVLHVQVFKKNDKRTIYNAVYRDGKKGPYYIKRFNVTTMTRERDYNLTNGTPNSKVVYFTANPNGEAEVIKVTLDPASKKGNIFIEKDFSDILIKGRAAKGNLLTKFNIQRIGLKSHGHSTLGGRKVWFDPDVNRLNYDEHGKLLGEFNEGDSILIVLDNGEFYITNFDANNHYEDNILIIEKWDEHKVWSLVLIDADNNNYHYIKRFNMEATKRHQNFVGENPNSKLIVLTDQKNPRVKVTYGGEDAFRGDQEIDVNDFISVKGFKAKGKRIATWEIDSVELLEPIVNEEEQEEEAQSNEEMNEQDNSSENLDPDKGKSQQDVIDEITGQLNLFNDEEDSES